MVLYVPTELRHFTIHHTEECIHEHIDPRWYCPNAKASAAMRSLIICYDVRIYIQSKVVYFTHLFIIPKYTYHTLN